MNNQNDQPSEENPQSTPDDQTEQQSSTCSTDFLTQEVDRLTKQTTEFKDKYLRSLAESENARKRMQKEKQDIIRYAIEDVVCDLLQPMDNLENALRFSSQGSDELRNWAQGFSMILTQFKDVLNNHGVQSFDSKGTQFDPHAHEAVETQETHDHAEGMIIEELTRGYRLGDKTIRPARVKVAKTPKKETKQDKQETEE
ncbi:MAG: nucleotide exchange factor GrpE [Parachlamydiales bacterium]|nr:nucleotide exchange factor GrpE [Parachlamydiales bacterium]